MRRAGVYIPAASVSPNLDSQFRFMSGWEVGLALIAWWIVPRRQGGPP